MPEPRSRRSRAKSTSRSAHGLAGRFSRSLPEDALRGLRSAGDEARRAGGQAYLVGGAVRDALLGRPTLDLDVVVEGSAIAVARSLAARHGGSARIHERFGTATWIPVDGPPIDLATARTETYPTPASLPFVAPGGLGEDLFRRDFTVNAMALRLAPGEFGELVDPYGGTRDLHARALRVLHPHSFVDDPTRAFRAARFAAELGMRVEPATARWLREALDAGLFERLSAARVRREIVRALCGPRPVAAARSLAKLGLLRTLHPKLVPSQRTWTLLRRTASAIDAHARRFPEEPIDRWAILLAATARSLDEPQLCELASRLHPTRSERERIAGGHADAAAVLRALARRKARDPVAIHAACRGHDLETLLLALALSERPAARAAIRRYLRKLRFLRLSISGDDLLRAGIPAGPRVAAGLTAALAAKLAGKAKSTGQELRAALEAAEETTRGAHGNT